MLAHFGTPFLKRCPFWRVNFSSDIRNTALSSVEIFDPASRQWLAAASVANSRTAHTATLLPDGRLLVVGGKGASYLASSELFAITRNGAQVAATMRH
jgi:hypothetical protein